MTDDSLREIIQAREKAKRDKEFRDWCEQIGAIPSDFELKLGGGLVADLELQPARWLTLGLDLLNSSRGTFAIQQLGSGPTPFMSSFLPYPIFQLGSEIFLKGLWLGQFEECRRITHFSYVDQSVRMRYAVRLKKELGHDLLRILTLVRQAECYQRDPEIVRFLKIVEGIVRRYYFPLYKADKVSSQWAHSRYPKRFYDDAEKQASAAAFQSHPPQWLIVKLFASVERHIEKLWASCNG